MSDNNVVDIFDWVSELRMPTPPTELVENTEENELSEADVSTFLCVLRHIQSMSATHTIDINVTANELKITTINDMSTDTPNEDVITSTGLRYTAKIEAFLPILDGLLNDEEETIILADSMVRSTIDGINSLHINNE